MNDRLREDVLKMYRDGKTNKSIKHIFGLGDNKLKEILRGHVEGSRTKALDMYDRESCREGIKERICRDLCIRMADLDEWLSFKKLQNKSKKMVLKNEEPKPKIRIQSGFSPWISYIVEKCYLEHLWRDKNENNKKMADVR